jgi:hypothetical protein
LAPAAGRARLFFESVSADANEPELISWTQSGQENGNKVLRNNAVTIPPVAPRNPAAGFHPHFGLTVCGGHHRTSMVLKEPEARGLPSTVS